MAIYIENNQQLPQIPALQKLSLLEFDVVLRKLISNGIALAAWSRSSC